MADTTEKKTYLINVESNLNKYAEDADKAAHKVVELTVANENLKSSEKASGAEIEASNAALRNAQKEYTHAKKLVDLQTTANNSNANSRKQLAAIIDLEKYKLGQLSNTITINAKGQRGLSQEYIKQKAALADAKKALIAYDQAQNDGRSNVGRYGESVSQSFKSMGMSMLSAAGPVALLTAGLAKLKEAFLSTETGAKVQKMWGEGVKTFFQSMIKGNIQTAGTDALIAAQIAKQMDETRKGNRKDLVEIAKLETEIELLNLKSVDSTKSKVEQQGYLIELQKKENELIDYRKKDLEDELADVNLMIAVRGDDTDLLNEQARIQAELLRLEGDRSLRVERRLSTLRQAEFEAAIKAKEELEKVLKDTEEATQKTFDKLEEDLRKQMQDQENDILAADIEKRTDRLTREQEAKLINQENLFQIEQSYYENEFQLQRNELERQRQLEVAYAKETGADVALVNGKYTRAAIKLAQYEQEAKLALYGGFAGSIAQLFGEQTAIGKAAAIAQTTIDTYLGAQKAFTSQIIPGDPTSIVRAYIAAGAAVVAGIANVKKIISVKSGLPGDSGSGPSSIASAPSVMHMTGIGTGSTILNQPQLSQSQLNAIPQQGGMTTESLAEAFRSLPAPVVSIEDINLRTEGKKRVEVKANI